MPGPTVVCFWKWIVWKDYEVPKNRNFDPLAPGNLLGSSHPVP
jgi:hypothetical protein